MSFYQRVVNGIAVDMFGPAPDFSHQQAMAGRALDEVCALIDRARAQPLGGGLVVPLKKIAGIIAHQLGGPEHDEEWVARSRTAASHLWDKVAGWLPLQPGGGEGSASPGTRELLGKPDPGIHPAYLEAAKAAVDFNFGHPAERTSIQPAGASAASVAERRQGFVPWEALDDEQRARIEEVKLDRVREWDIQAWRHRYPDPRPETTGRFWAELQFRAKFLAWEEIFPRKTAALAGQLVERGSLSVEEISSLFHFGSVGTRQPARAKKEPGGSAESAFTVKRVSNYPCCGGEVRFQIPLPNPWGGASPGFVRICPKCGKPFRVYFRIGQASYSGRNETCEWRDRIRP